MIKHNFTKNQKSEVKSMELKFYHRYQHIKNRCISPKNPSYKNYMGKGIKFNWNSFEEFRDDMYPSFLEHIQEFGEKNTTIDRINSNGNYCKENCRWATQKDQRRNSSQNLFFDYKGERLALVSIAEKEGVPYRRLVKRIAAGWSLDDALFTPSRINQYA